jgi:hypothetical protein
VVGGDGNDWVVAGEVANPVKDTLSSGGGNDLVAVINDPAGKDVVACGSGFDRVLADRADLIAPACERVFGASGRFLSPYRIASSKVCIPSSPNR